MRSTVRRRTSYLRGGESGQVTAYFIATAIVLFGITALAFDGGLIFLQRRTAQNVVDSASIAGANSLERCPLAAQGEPLAVAEDFANRNLVVGSNTVADYGEPPQTRIGSVTVTEEIGGNTMTATWDTVKVRVDRDQRFVFAQALGVFGVNVPAEAEAACGPIKEGNVCPMYVPGDPDQPPVYGTDPDGPGGPLEPPLLSAYGLNIGQVYLMKASAAHIGALEAPTGPGVSQWRSFIQDGCVDSDPPFETLEIVEGGTVDTKPGDWGNPATGALEGQGGGPNGDGLYEEELVYETLGYPGPDLYPFGHLDCDLHLTVDDPDDPSVVTEVRLYDANRNPTGSPLTPVQILAAINSMTNPDDMPSGNPAPCGGIRKDGSIVSELVTEAVQGRFMQIVLTDGWCGNCDLPVLGILRMYIVCWTNQEAQSGNIPASKLCVPDTPPSRATIYGMFGDFEAPSLLGGGGLGTNPLAPFHVVLVR